MKAALLTKLNAPLELREITSSKLQVGQVLVKVLTSGLCGAQLQEIDGRKGNAKYLPHLLGHEGCGLVVEVGNGVTTVQVGDKVVMHWRPAAGIDSNFPTYFLDGYPFSSGKLNTLTEYAIVSENRITTVPSDTNPELAALLGCSLTTSLGLIENQSNLRFGESVLILGCGGVGLNLISAARLRGAGKISSLDSMQSKNQLAIDLGANFFYDKYQEVPGIYDLIIDTTGNTALIGWAFTKLSNQGRMILVGQPRPGQELVLPNAVRFFDGDGLRLTATQGGSTNPDKDIHRYLEMFSLGKLSIGKLITHRYTLDQINDAVACLQSGAAGRIMIGIGVE